MAKGYTGASRGCCRHASTASSGNTHTSTGDDTPFFYGQAAVYPTRVANSAAVLFTWHSRESDSYRRIISIRRYLTTTYPPNIQANANWTPGDENPFSDSMNTLDNRLITSSCADGELYRDWVDVMGCYVVFAIQYERDDEISGVSWYWDARQITSNVYAPAPSLSYNSESGEFTIGTSMIGRRILEFYCTDHPYGYPTAIHDEETLNEMYYTALVNMERDYPYAGYYYLRGAELNRWTPGSYTVGVQFRSSYNQSTISSAIDHAIEEINRVLGIYGIDFTRTGTSGDISILVDTEYNLFGIDPETADYVYGGTWETQTNSSGKIVGADIKLANDYYGYVPYIPYRAVAMEELLQSMGAGYDQIEYPFDTIHTDLNYYNKADYITDKDADILRLVYDGSISPGYDCTQTALSLNIPKGCYVPGSSASDTAMTVSDAFLARGSNYRVRVFVVNVSGEVSETSGWMDVSIPAKVRPDKFQWTYPKVQGGDFHLTAAEWNAFTANINAMRDYYSLSPYSFSTAQAGNDFTAGHYNQARQAIQDIDGYGTYIPTVRTGDAVTADVMNTIVSELNAIP